MKPTKFIVLDELNAPIAPNAYTFTDFTDEAFKRDMQDTVRSYQRVKGYYQADGIEYIPKTLTLYKLTKVKEFQL